MKSKKKDYVHEHERKFYPSAGYCWGCHKEIRTCDAKCPNCGAPLKESPRRFPQRIEKIDTFEDDKNK